MVQRNLELGHWSSPMGERPWSNRLVWGPGEAAAASGRGLITVAARSLARASLLGLGFTLAGLGADPIQATEASGSLDRLRLAQVPSSTPVRPPLVEPNPQVPLPSPDVLLETAPDLPSLNLPDSQPPGSAVPDTDIPGGDITIVVDQFTVVGSTVFTEAELQAALAPFVGRPLTLAELLQARTAITQLYIDAGYVTSGAYIPPQESADGRVTIEVIEGELIAIEVEGTRRLQPSYVSSRLALGAGTPLKVDQLVEALRLLQIDPLIDNISGDLAAGLEPGTSVLSVTVEEADSFDVDFVTNNNRSPLVGTWERGLFLNEGNLTGLGDSLRLGYLNTDGSDRVIGEYQIPINPRNGTLGAYFEYTHSSVISDPEAILDINTDSYLLDLSFRQPLILTPTEEFALSLIGSWSKSRSVYLEEVLGSALPYPAFGANDDGEIEVFALRFAQDWVKRGAQDVFAARSQFNLGLGGSTPTVGGADAPDSQFFSWLAQAQWAHLLAADTLLLVRAEAQLASDTLPAQELFGLGGQRTVRGYRQDRLLTDNALLATAEVRLPILRSRERQALLQIVPFFDVGTGWNTRLPNPDLTTLVGTGVGFLWTEGDYWNARVDWGIPLNGSQDGNSWQENGIYFSIGYSGF